MKASQPCDLCGCTEVNLHDGFYFCIECGTQDANFQETLVDVVELGTEGHVLLGTKKKIHKVVEEEKEMSDAWYRWHAFNFLLKGTADELLEFGAKPSFKTKLMWVWTRYMKKYLKQNEMGFNKDPHKPIVTNIEEDVDSDVDQPPEDLLTVWEMKRDSTIISFSFTLLVSLVAIALNLDKSDITLTQLVKLFRDGLLSVPYRIENIVPKEMKPEKLFKKIRKGLAKFKAPGIRIIAMTLFKSLDLGNPIVPDLRLIIDNHLKELCLPMDLKPLVLSLMHYKPAGFLDVNTKDKIINRLPAYEFHVMTYIIWAMKLCLGLDCEYEVKLSKAAEAINEKEDRPRSFYFHGESAPTNRLFSYRDWMTFYQFRQILLRHYCFRYANKCSWDTDDYIALEHHIDLLHNEHQKTLKDEMAHELVTRLKGGEVGSFVIPKSEFKPTLTPFHSYTQVLAHHLQDPEVKVKLTEDFTQYALKYAIEDWHLVDPYSKKKENLVKGIEVSNKEVTNEFDRYKPERIYVDKMIYVRNCENHNWLTTKPPTVEHLVKVDKLQASTDDNQGLGNTQSDNPESQTNEQLNQNQEPDKATPKSNSISECSLANSTISNRLQFEDSDILDSNKLDETEKCKLRELSDSIASNIKFPETVSEHSFTNSTLSNSIRYLDDTKVFESTKLNESEKDKLKEIHDRMTNPNEIREETEGVNIFDDDFKPVIKEELEDHCGMDENAFNVTDNFEDVPIGINVTENRNGDNDSVGSSMDSVVYNEASFDRAKAIRDIILYTCQKHRLPLPPEYNNKTRKKDREMGIFTKNITGFAESKKNNIKKNRNFTIEKERRGEWKNFVTAYHDAVKEDALAQIARKVNEAIQNADITQEANETPTCDAEDANTDDRMDVDMPCTNSNHTNDKDCEEVPETRKTRNESDEERLFSDDSEGETYAKELLPEKNPDFDEELHDSSQLYVKAAKSADPGEMELDPQLSGIIDKKIIKDAKDPSLLTWTEERKKIPRPDSEDEMPLSVLQELKELTKQLSKQERECLEPLLKEPVENIQYWLKFYVFLEKQGAESRVFEKEVSNELPKSFAFLLRQCAHILDVSEGKLYKNLQYFETTFTEKSGFKLKSSLLKGQKTGGYLNY